MVQELGHQFSIPRPKANHIEIGAHHWIMQQGMNLLSADGAITIHISCHKELDNLVQNGPLFVYCFFDLAFALFFYCSELPCPQRLL